MQDRGEFLEVVGVDTMHGGSALYGISYAAVRSVASGGKVCLIALDVQGVQVLHEDSRIDAAFVYVAPPDIGTVRARLAARPKEASSTTQKRLAWAKEQVLAFDIWLRLTLSGVLLCSLQIGMRPPAQGYSSSIVKYVFLVLATRAVLSACARQATSAAEYQLSR